jgi:hypothetical protein
MQSLRRARGMADLGALRAADAEASVKELQAKVPIAPSFQPVATLMVGAFSRSTLSLLHLLQQAWVVQLLRTQARRQSFCRCHEIRLPRRVRTEWFSHRFSLFLRAGILAYFSKNIPAYATL